MKFQKIQALVPEGEHFDESALINEGGFITVNHLNSINAALEQHDEIVARLTAELNAAQEESQRVASLEADLAQSAETILDLQAQLAALNAAPSGTGTTLDSKADDQPDDRPVPSYLSDSNPINSWVDKKLPRK